jgi:hypothetical protein
MAEYWGGFENGNTFHLWRRSLAYQALRERIRSSGPFNAALAKYTCECEEMPASMLEGVNWQEIADNWNGFFGYEVKHRHG